MKVDLSILYRAILNKDQFNYKRTEKQMKLELDKKLKNIIKTERLILDITSFLML